MATFPIAIQPFAVPKKVTLNVPTSSNRQDGFQPNPDLDIKSLSVEVLQTMIDDFAEALWKYHGGKEELPKGFQVRQHGNPRSPNP